MKEFTLKNDIKSVYKQNKNTPRMAFTLNVAITEPEKLAGTYSLMNRLLLQGTKKYSNTELAKVLDENAIELYTDMKQDYLRFRFVCLNEDFELAIKILDDIINNTTFDEFDKEKEKMRGEIVAELDSARTKVSDAFIKTIYENHYYGNTYTKMLETLDKITKQDVIDAYYNILKLGQKISSTVGSLEFSEIEPLLEQTIGSLENNSVESSKIEKPKLDSAKRVDVIKEDANQAQIYQGWLVPNFESEDYPVLAVINTILGASGLSSRLFLELRDKKGLAYTVRTSCESHLKSAIFSIYIATEPKNIDVSLAGFKEEIDKIKEELVSEEELTNAKNNIIGKQQFITETNSQQSTALAYYGIMGLGFDYQAKIIDKIKKVTSEQLKECANKYFTDKSVITVLRP